MIGVVNALFTSSFYPYFVLLPVFPFFRICLFSSIPLFFSPAAAGWPLSELWHKEIANVIGLDSILVGTYCEMCCTYRSVLWLLYVTLCYVVLLYVINFLSIYFFLTMITNSQIMQYNNFEYSYHNNKNKYCKNSSS